MLESGTSAGSLFQIVGAAKRYGTTTCTHLLECITVALTPNAMKQLSL